jgi:hypothetical protein
LRADALESTEFVCDTEPPFPGLRTRTDTFTFSGFSCVACDPASAACSFPACWSMVWTPSDGAAGQHVAFGAPADCDCATS